MGQSPSCERDSAEESETRQEDNITNSMVSLSGDHDLTKSMVSPGGDRDLIPISSTGGHFNKEIEANGRVLHSVLHPGINLQKSYSDGSVQVYSGTIAEPWKVCVCCECALCLLRYCLTHLSLEKPSAGVNVVNGSNLIEAGGGLNTVNRGFNATAGYQRRFENGVTTSLAGGFGAMNKHSDGFVQCAGTYDTGYRDTRLYGGARSSFSAWGEQGYSGFGGIRGRGYDLRMDVDRYGHRESLSLNPFEMRK